jgi:hypothetical protein
VTALTEPILSLAERITGPIARCTPSSILFRILLLFRPNRVMDVMTADHPRKENIYDDIHNRR